MKLETRINVPGLTWVVLVLILALHISSYEGISCYHCQLNAEPFLDERCATRAKTTMDCDNNIGINALAPWNKTSFYNDTSSSGCMTIQFAEETIEKHKGKEYHGNGVTKTCFPNLYKKCIERLRSFKLKPKSCFLIIGDNKILKFLNDLNYCINETLEGRSRELQMFGSESESGPEEDGSGGGDLLGLPIPRMITVDGNVIKSKLTKYHMCYCSEDLCNNKEEAGFFTNSKEPIIRASTIHWIYPILIIFQCLSI